MCYNPRMNIDLLKSKQTESDNKFNNLQKEKEQLNEQIKNIDIEQVKLQGEYRVLQSLIDETEKDNIDKLKEGEIVDATSN